MHQQNSRRGWLFIALAMLVVGLVGLVQVYFALNHHSLVFAHFARLGPAWVEPWQGALAFSLLAGVGFALLVTTLRKARR
jgi:hypothetical protein